MLPWFSIFSVVRQSPAVTGLSPGSHWAAQPLRLGLVFHICSCQAVTGQSPGSHRAVTRQSPGSNRAVTSQSPGSHWAAQPLRLETFQTCFFCFQVRKLCLDSSHRLSYISNTDPNGNFNSRKFNCCNFWSEYACRTEIKIHFLGKLTEFCCHLPD